MNDVPEKCKRCRWDWPDVPKTCAIANRSSCQTDGFASYEPRIPADVVEKVEAFTEYLVQGITEADRDLANPTTGHRCCKEAARHAVVDILNEFADIREAMKGSE